MTISSKGCRSRNKVQTEGTGGKQTSDTALRRPKEGSEDGLTLRSTYSRRKKSSASRAVVAKTQKTKDQRNKEKNVNCGYKTTGGTKDGALNSRTVPARNKCKSPVKASPSRASYDDCKQEIRLFDSDSKVDYFQKPLKETLKCKKTKKNSSSNKLQADVVSQELDGRQVSSSDAHVNYQIEVDRISREPLIKGERLNDERDVLSQEELSFLICESSKTLDSGAEVVNIEGLKPRCLTTTDDNWVPPCGEGICSVPCRVDNTLKSGCLSDEYCIEGSRTPCPEVAYRLNSTSSSASVGSIRVRDASSFLEPVDNDYDDVIFVSESVVTADDRPTGSEKRYHTTPPSNSMTHRELLLKSKKKLMEEMLKVERELYLSGLDLSRDGVIDLSDENSPCDSGSMSPITISDDELPNVTSNNQVQVDRDASPVDLSCASNKDLLKAINPNLTSVVQIERLDSSSYSAYSLSHLSIDICDKDLGEGPESSEQNSLYSVNREVVANDTLCTSQSQFPSSRGGKVKKSIKNSIKNFRKNVQTKSENGCLEKEGDDYVPRRISLSSRRMSGRSRGGSCRTTGTTDPQESRNKPVCDRDAVCLKCTSSRRGRRSCNTASQVECPHGLQTWKRPSLSNTPGLKRVKKEVLLNEDIVEDIKPTLGEIKTETEHSRTADKNQPTKFNRNSSKNRRLTSVSPKIKIKEEIMSPENSSNENNCNSVDEECGSKENSKRPAKLIRKSGRKPHGDKRPDAVGRLSRSCRKLFLDEKTRNRVSKSKDCTLNSKVDKGKGKVKRGSQKIEEQPAAVESIDIKPFPARKPDTYGSRRKLRSSVDIDNNVPSTEDCETNKSLPADTACLKKSVSNDQRRRDINGRSDQLPKSEIEGVNVQVVPNRDVNCDEGDDRPSEAVSLKQRKKKGNSLPKSEQITSPEPVNPEEIKRTNVSDVQVGEKNTAVVGGGEMVRKSPSDVSLKDSAVRPQIERSDKLDSFDESNNTLSPEKQRIIDQLLNEMIRYDKSLQTSIFPDNPNCFSLEDSPQDKSVSNADPKECDSDDGVDKTSVENRESKRKKGIISFDSVSVSTEETGNISVETTSNFQKGERWQSKEKYRVEDYTPLVKSTNRTKKTVSEEKTEGLDSPSRKDTVTDTSNIETEDFTDYREGASSVLEILNRPEGGAVQEKSFSNKVLKSGSDSSKSESMKEETTKTEEETTNVPLKQSSSSKKNERSRWKENRKVKESTPMNSVKAYRRDSRKETIKGHDSLSSVPLKHVSQIESDVRLQNRDETSPKKSLKTPKVESLQTEVLKNKIKRESKKPRGLQVVKEHGKTDDGNVSHSSSPNHVSNTYKTESKDRRTSIGSDKEVRLPPEAITSDIKATDSSHKKFESHDTSKEKKSLPDESKYKSDSEKSSGSTKDSTCYEKNGKDSEKSYKDPKKRSDNIKKDVKEDPRKIPEKKRGRWNCKDKSDSSRWHRKCGVLDVSCKENKTESKEKKCEEISNTAKAKEKHIKVAQSRDDTAISYRQPKSHGPGYKRPEDNLDGDRKSPDIKVKRNKRKQECCWSDSCKEPRRTGSGSLIQSSVENVTNNVCTSNTDLIDVSVGSLPLNPQIIKEPVSNAWNVDTGSGATRVTDSTECVDSSDAPKTSRSETFQSSLKLTTEVTIDSSDQELDLSLNQNQSLSLSSVETNQQSSDDSRHLNKLVAMKEGIAFPLKSGAAAAHCVIDAAATDNPDKVTPTDVSSHHSLSVQSSLNDTSRNTFHSTHPPIKTSASNPDPSTSNDVTSNQKSSERTDEIVASVNTEVSILQNGHKVSPGRGDSNTADSIGFAVEEVCVEGIRMFRYDACLWKFYGDPSWSVGSCKEVSVAPSVNDDAVSEGAEVEATILKTVGAREEETKNCDNNIQGVPYNVESLSDMEKFFLPFCRDLLKFNECSVTDCSFIHKFDAAVLRKTDFGDVWCHVGNLLGGGGESCVSTDVFEAVVSWLGSEGKRNKLLEASLYVASLSPEKVSNDYLRRCWSAVIASYKESGVSRVSAARNILQHLVSNSNSFPVKRLQDVVEYIGLLEHDIEEVWPVVKVLKTIQNFRFSLTFFETLMKNVLRKRKCIVGVIQDILVNFTRELIDSDCETLFDIDFDLADRFSNRLKDFRLPNNNYIRLQDFLQRLKRKMVTASERLDRVPVSLKGRSPDAARDDSTQKMTSAVTETKASSKSLLSISKNEVVKDKSAEPDSTFVSHSDNSCTASKCVDSFNTGYTSGSSMSSEVPPYFDRSNPVPPHASFPNNKTDPREKKDRVGQTFRRYNNGSRGCGSSQTYRTSHSQSRSFNDKTQIISENRVNNRSWEDLGKGKVERNSFNSSNMQISLWKGQTPFRHTSSNFDPLMSITNNSSGGALYPLNTLPPWTTEPISMSKFPSDELCDSFCFRPRDLVTGSNRSWSSEVGQNDRKRTLLNDGLLEERGSLKRRQVNPLENLSNTCYNPTAQLYRNASRSDDSPQQNYCAQRQKVLSQEESTCYRSPQALSDRSDLLPRDYNNETKDFPHSRFSSLDSAHRDTVYQQDSRLPFNRDLRNSYDKKETSSSEFDSDCSGSHPSLSNDWSRVQRSFPQPDPNPCSQTTLPQPLALIKLPVSKVQRTIPVKSKMMSLPFPRGTMDCETDRSNSYCKSNGGPFGTVKLDSPGTSNTLSASVVSLQSPVASQKSLSIFTNEIPNKTCVTVKMNINITPQKLQEITQSMVQLLKDKQLEEIFSVACEWTDNTQVMKNLAFSIIDAFQSIDRTLIYLLIKGFFHILYNYEHEHKERKSNLYCLFGTMAVAIMMKAVSQECWKNAFDIYSLLRNAGFSETVDERFMNYDDGYTQVVVAIAICEILMNTKRNDEAVKIIIDNNLLQDRGKWVLAGHESDVDIVRQMSLLLLETMCENAAEDQLISTFMQEIVDSQKNLRDPINVIPSAELLMAVYHDSNQKSKNRWLVEFYQYLKAYDDINDFSDISLRILLINFIRTRYSKVEEIYELCVSRGLYPQPLVAHDKLWICSSWQKEEMWFVLNKWFQAIALHLRQRGNLKSEFIVKYQMMDVSRMERTKRPERLLKIGQKIEEVHARFNQALNFYNPPLMYELVEFEMNTVKLHTASCQKLVYRKLESILKL